MCLENKANVFGTTVQSSGQHTKLFMKIFQIQYPWISIPISIRVLPASKCLIHIPILPRYRRQSYQDCQYRLTHTSYQSYPDINLQSYQDTIIVSQTSYISSTQSVQIFHKSDVHEKVNPTKCVILYGLKPLWLV